MYTRWLSRTPSEKISVYVVWSPQLGATERHVDDATTLIPDRRVRHYWDPNRSVGSAYQHYVGLESPAWDVWLLFDRDAVWYEEPPEPAWWEHQLGGLPPERHLDFDRFRRRAEALLQTRQPASESSGSTGSVNAR